MRIVIIGNGTAGVHAVKAILENEPKAEITLISDDEPIFYSRPEITQLIGDPYGLSHIALPFPSDFSERVSFLQDTVESIDPGRRMLTLRNRSTLFYDRLILATGAAPKRVKVVGVPNDRIMTLRTAGDAKRIADFLCCATRPIVLGGGLVGLKIAHTLSHMGLSPKVLVSSQQILSRNVDAKTARVIQKLFEEHGVEFIFGAMVKSGDWNARREEGVLLLEGGGKIPFDLVLVGKGIVPRVTLAEEAGLLIEGGGIAVSDAMETSSEGHYAAGDCASIFNHESGRYENRAIWPVATESGRVAGEAVVGKLISARRFSAPVSRNAIPFFSVPMVSIGTIQGEGLKVTSFEDPSRTIVRKVFQEGGKVVGAVLIGDITHAGLLFEAVRTGVRIRKIPDWLVEGVPSLSQQTPSMEVLFS